MSKRLKTFLASLLVICLLVTGLSFAALSETMPADPVETQAIEPTEEPTMEATEAPVETPAASTEAPAAESTETPTAEPTAEPTATPTEAPAEEPAEEEIDIPDDEAGEYAVTLARTVGTPCAHENTYSEEVVLKGSDYTGQYDMYDEDNGTFYGIYYNEKFDANIVKISRVTTYCSDCEEKLKETLKYDRSNSELTYHGFTEDNGYKCVNCGFACPHTETYEFKIPKDYNYNYVAVGAEGHQYTVTYTEVETVCKACGKCFSSEKINRTENVVEKHSCYDGVCLDCGYVYDSCKHENILRAGADGGGWVIIDENYHRNDMTFNWSDKYDYCRDCGCSVKDGKVVQNPGDDAAGEERYNGDIPAESHTFENGVCKYCGYQKQEEKSCDHSAGNFRDELDASVAPKYYNITETTHCVQYSYKRYCKDCGDYIKNVWDLGTEETHSFNNNGICDCRYECPHTTTKAATGAKKKISQINDNSTYHKVETVEITICKCTVCGKELSKDSKVIDEKLEEHDLARVCKCGFTEIDQEKLYKKVLSDLSEDTDPMDNPIIVQTMVKRLLIEGLTEEETVKIIETVKEAPEIYRNIYVYSFFEYDIDDLNSKEGSSFDPDTNGFKIGVNTSPAHFMDTWFHESGHAIDWNAGFEEMMSMEECFDLYSALESDLASRVYATIADEVSRLLRNKINPASVVLQGDEVSKIRGNIIGSENAPCQRYGIPFDPDPYNLSGDVLTIYKRTRNAVSNNLKRVPYSNAEMGSDINGGLSNNTVRGSGGHSYPFSSGTAYWFNGGSPTYKQCGEAWAEYYAAYMLNDTSAIARNRSYFPNGCAILDEIAQQMCDYYMSQY